MNRLPFEIYVHIPFCVRKCRYCDFLSGPASGQVREAYIQALLRELNAAAQEEYADNNGRSVTSVFIGGGTPSILEGTQIAEILSSIRRDFRVAADAEITMEANPGTVTRGKLAAYRNAGMNRLSLGLQSVNDRELVRLGRIHRYQDFMESLCLARNAGFCNINVDLMFGLPGQNCEEWRHTLRTAAELKPEHISAYSLIIEAGTPFGENPPELPDEDTEYQMYEDTAAVLAEYGYRQYEISNYAKPGFACRHNIGYWQGTEYLGLGLGAASLYRGERFVNTRNMEEYLKSSGNLMEIRKERQILTKKDRMEEFMFLGLRMTEGVSEEEFYRRFDRTINEIYGPVLKKYQDMGLLQYKNKCWSFTRSGIHVSNPVLADFLL